MKLYEYEIRVKAGSPKIDIKAKLNTYELIADTKQQYVYLDAATGLYHIVSKDNKGYCSSEKGAYYSKADKYFDIKPSFRAWLFTTKHTKAKANKVKEMLKKCIYENLGFLNEGVIIDIDAALFIKEE